MAALTKTQKALIRALHTRHGRKKYALCLCEGVRCCSEVLKARPELVRFAVRTDAMKDLDLQNVPEIINVSDDELNRFSATGTPQGILLVAAKPDFLNNDVKPRDKFILVLDRVGDPGNFGTIIRTVRAAGLTELWFTEGSADPFSDKVIRSALGGQFSIGLRCLPELAAAKQLLNRFGYNNIFRTDPHRGISCFTAEALFEKSALIIGSEASGAAALAGTVDVTIPMPGQAESLNAAQAATILLFEYVRRYFRG